MNNEFIDEYDYENVQRKLMNSNRNEGYNEGLEVGLNQGMSLGISKGVKQIAKIMLSKNIDTKTISELTSLTEDEIDELNSED